MPKPANPTTEVVAQPENDRPRRRLFSPEERERILAEADACTKRGQLGELLRREGIYSSHLSTWRAQRKAHGKEGLKRKRPGPKPTRDERDRVIAKLEREKAKLERELRITRSLVELQKKAHEILGIALPNPEDATEDARRGAALSRTSRKTVGPGHTSRRVAIAGDTARTEQLETTRALTGDPQISGPPRTIVVNTTSPSAPFGWLRSLGTTDTWTPCSARNCSASVSKWVPRRGLTRPGNFGVGEA